MCDSVRPQVLRIREGRCSPRALAPLFSGRGRGRFSCLACVTGRSPGFLLGGNGARIPGHGLVDGGGAGHVGENTPSIDCDDAVGARGFGGVVGDVDDGDAGVGQGGEEIEHVGAPVAVDHGGGFVGDEQARRAGECPCEREALQLPAGEGARVGVGQAIQAHARQEGFEVEGPRVASTHAPGDVFGDVLAEDQQFGALSDQGGAADLAEHAAAGARPLAGGGTGEEEGEGGLAGAVVSDDDRVFGALEAERDIAQRGVVGARVGEGSVGES